MENGFTMSQEKTMATCFTRYNMPVTANVTIYNIKFTIKSEINYLGL